MRERRRWLLGAAALGALGLGAAAWRHWPEQGFANPCKAVLPPELARDEVLQAVWEGLDPGRVWDSHVHLVGIGDSGSGVTVNERMWSPLAPLLLAQLLFYLNAACVHADRDRVDQAYVERMHNLLEGMPRGVKLLLFAFDAYVTEAGEVDPARTAFHVPNGYAGEVARRDVRHFEWAASIHPYRRDAVERLEQAVRDGARAVKWLPSAMGIDPAAPRCDPFYAALARLGVPLISHAGHEAAVSIGGAQAYGNPLRLRRALDHGVRVVVAHCASLGADRDLDRGSDGPLVPSFELFARMMEEPRYQGRLFGDISAMTQRNRVGAPLRAVIERADWHPRLLHGSDYPLPGIMPLVSLDELASQGFITARVGAVLKRVREHNPLLFDLALKRHLQSNGKRLPPAVFETRAFFAPGTG